MELAAQWHDGTYRKSQWRDAAFEIPDGAVLRVPVMVHVTAVALTLQRAGWDDETVAAAGKLVLVDFWADWCGPCHAIAPVLEELAANYGGRVTVAKVNVDENNRKAAEFGVRAIPTLILFRDGTPVQTLVGVQTKSALQAVIDAHLA